MEISLLTQIASLGLGAVIAVIVLIWKRTDDQAHAKALEIIILRMDAQSERILKVMEATTIALQSLQRVVESLEMLSKLEERIAGLEAPREKKRRN
uniref:Uncharacterized protein n=1 Tax=viral metagenome TaxID=1070528 RepID=A0A6H1ZEL8_9ZZZZ